MALLNIRQPRNSGSLWAVSSQRRLVRCRRPRLVPGPHDFVIPGRSRSVATSRRPWNPCRAFRRRMQRCRMRHASCGDCLEEILHRGQQLW